jgi:hypothetical protein
MRYECFCDQTGVEQGFIYRIIRGIVMAKVRNASHQIELLEEDISEYLDTRLGDVRYPGRKSRNYGSQILSPFLRSQ